MRVGLTKNSKNQVHSVETPRIDFLDNVPEYTIIQVVFGEKFGSFGMIWKNFSPEMKIWRPFGGRQKGCRYSRKG